LIGFFHSTNPTFVINCAGFTGKPNVDVCEDNKEETLLANAELPRTIAKACKAFDIPFGHVSSGCIYGGYEKDFTEEDEPNFCFDSPPCSYYSGTKALGEHYITNMYDQHYIWRLRIPFDEYDSPRNYLTKLQKYDRLLDMKNSISHRSDFVKACIELWLNDSEYGIYNVVNSGSVTAQRVVTLIKKYLNLSKDFEFFKSEEEMYKVAAKAARSNCVLDNSKLISAGVEIRSAEDAIIDSLKNWKENVEV
jgi:UDP-glucose 4,6-dehydratase